MVRLRNLAAEVTRVSMEVGSQGKLGGEAVVRDVEGVWHDLTVNVSCFAGSFVRPLLIFLLGQPYVL